MEAGEVAHVTSLYKDQPHFIKLTNVIGRMVHSQLIKYVGPYTSNDHGNDW